MADLIGKSLGRYHILEQLGEGGMALVYKAYDTRLETDVAVKVIRTENLPQSGVERALKRFEREAKALAKLTHANIVKILDYGEYDSKPYLVMPYLHGGTLKEQLKGKPIVWQEAVRLLSPVTRALAYAHSEGMVHRDVKPSNILITKTGDPMLTDFGIAKVIDEEVTVDLTGTSAAVGTPEYMAPEQVTSKTVDQRADIYALGVVFYEMITGRKPFQADTPMAVLFKHATEPLPRPNLFVPDLPDKVEKFLIKALAKNRDERYQTMSEMSKVLEGLIENKLQKETPVSKARPKPMPISPQQPEETLATVDQIEETLDTVDQIVGHQATLKQGPATIQQKSQADLLVKAQHRKKKSFRIGVGVTWGVLLLVLIFLFSGKTVMGFETIKLDTEFMRKNIVFIGLGLGETLLVSILSISLAMALALLTALGRLSTFPPIFAISTFYVSLIRGTPLYLQIIFFFLALPQLGIILSGLTAGVLALGLNYGAYMSETFRAALASVGKGQREAATALDKPPHQTMKRIILPQALRFAIHPMGNDFISMTKDSALVAATGFVHEVMWRATKVGRAQFNNLEALLMAAIFYWLMTLVLTFFQTRLEARLSKGNR